MIDYVSMLFDFPDGYEFFVYFICALICCFFFCLLFDFIVFIFKHIGGIR